MKYLLLSLFIVITTTGCGQCLHQQVEQNARKGMSQQEAIEKLGFPTENSGNVWTYRVKHDACKMLWGGDQNQSSLQAWQCEHGSAWAAGLKAFGENMQKENTKQKNLNCSSYGSGPNKSLDCTEY